MSDAKKGGRELLYTALAAYVDQQHAEQKSRKWRWRFILVSMAIYMIFNVVYMLSKDQHLAVSGNYAAVVRVDGEINVGKLASTDVLFPVLEKAFADKKAACVALVVNSPGGTVGQSQMLHDRIRKLAKQNDKKVIAVGEDLVASGGYLVASSASRIYAPTMAAVGSIGVRLDGYDLTGIAEKLGIKDRTFTAGTMKDMVNPLRPVTPEAEAKIRHDVEQIHSEFIRMVKESRGDRLKLPDDKLFTGEVFTGMDGKAFGLLDGNLDLEDAVKADCGADSVVAYEPKLGPGQLLNMLMGR